MSDMPTIVETGKNEGWGGSGLAAGLGGLVGSWFGQGFGGGWGWGGGRGAGQVGADVAISNSLDHVSEQVQQGTVSQLQSANGLQQTVSGAAAGIANAQYQQTIANLQGQNQQNLAMVQGFGGVGQQLCCLGKSLAQDIDQTGDQIAGAVAQLGMQGVQNAQNITNGLGNLNQNVTNQGYQNQLQTKDVLAAMAGQTADLKATIIEQGCQDRETMRAIADQQVRDKLAEANAKIANLETRQALTDSNQNQTLYMMAQIQNLFQQYKTTPTTAAGA